MSDSIGVVMACPNCNSEERVYFTENQLNDLTQGDVKFLSGKRFIVKSYEGTTLETVCMECCHSFPKTVDSQHIGKIFGG